MHEQGRDSNPRSAEMTSDVLPLFTAHFRVSIFTAGRIRSHVGVVEQATDSLQWRSTMGLIFMCWYGLEAAGVGVRLVDEPERRSAPSPTLVAVATSCRYLLRR